MIKLIVTESVHGNWYYHLSIHDKYTKGLCGANTMLTHLPTDMWGTKGHLNERYCKKCEHLTREGIDNYDQTGVDNRLTKGRKSYN